MNGWKSVSEMLEDMLFVEGRVLADQLIAWCHLI